VKGISGSEAIARRKEHDEERKMTWSLVAKVEYMVVERVVKLWSLMGSWWRNEEEEGGKDGVMVVVVVEMKEEMEENEVVVLVEKMEEKWWRNGRPRQAHGCHFRGLSLAVKERRKKKVKERGRRKGGGGYI